MAKTTLCSAPQTELKTVGGKEIKNHPYGSFYYEKSVRDKSHYIVINKGSAVNNEKWYTCVISTPAAKENEYKINNSLNCYWGAR